MDAARLVPPQSPPSPTPSVASTTVSRSAAKPPAPPPKQAAHPYPLLDGQRDKFAKHSGSKRRRLQAMSAAQLIETRDKFTDAIEGRDREALAMWDEGYTELWELLQERDKLAELEQLHLKKINRLSDRCFDLDEKVDELKARCQVLEGHEKTVRTCAGSVRSSNPALEDCSDILE